MTITIIVIIGKAYLVEATTKPWVAATNFKECFLDWIDLDLCFVDLTILASEQAAYYVFNFAFTAVFSLVLEVEFREMLSLAPAMLALDCTAFTKPRFDSETFIFGFD